MFLCKYSTSLGVPGEGNHANGAILDWLFTFFGAIIIGTMISYYKNTPLIFTIFITFIIIYIIGIFLHWLFCVKTRVNKYLGLIN